MDNALSALLSWQFLMFALGIFAIMWVVRTVAEYFVPNLGDSKLWEKLLLPLLPVFFGGIVAFFAKKYPYPDGLSNFSARLMFGAVSGLFSGTVYQVVKGVLKQRIQSFIQGNGLLNQPPPPPPSVIIQQQNNQGPPPGFGPPPPNSPSISGGNTQP